MRLFLSLLLTCIFTCQILAKETITASVSPEFPNGVHAQYLKYLFQELGTNISIKPMPLARRIKELEKGSIDIIVLGHRSNPNLIFIEPPYNTLDIHLFVRKQDKNKIKNYQELNETVIGHSIDSKIFPEFDQHDSSTKVAVNSLRQKILLLEQGRIDGFFHVYLSTKRRLKEMNLHEQIVKSRWQPIYRRDYYFVISEKSKLFQHQNKLKEIIKQGKTLGQFKAIRTAYYQ